MSPLIKPDGLHQLQREDYDSIERVNYSSLKLIGRSPAHYRHGLLEEREDTDALKFGRVTRLAVLEPERFRSLIAVWDGGRRAGKDWDKFVEQHQGRELLTQEEHKRCLDLQQAVRNDARAMRYISGGQPEVTVLWTAEVGGRRIPCKARLDFDTDAALVELKTTRNAEPSAFGRQAHGLGYHVQASWQVDGYARAAGIGKPHVTVSVEKDPPHVVQVYRMPERYLEMGRLEYRTWLDRLVECRESARWPGYADIELELEFPPWATGADEDLGGLGLTSGGAPLAAQED
jgi:exodeoxyribonuclease VIII